MIKVITPFSLLNDDFKTESGKLFPVINMLYSDNVVFNNAQMPFFLIFTDKMGK